MANQQNSRSGNHKKQVQNKSKHPGSKKKGSIGSIIFKIFIGLFFLGCLGLLSGVGLFWYYAKDAPDLEDSALESPISSQLFAANDELFLEIGSEKRELLTASEIPQQLEDAIVSVEDRRFYNHIGVDPIRIVGSALSNVVRGGMQGGSTLTQQLIKLSFFSTKAEDQTLRRKAQEAWLSVQLEQEKSKQEILTYYINKVYMSNGVYGMLTAAEEFYDKPLSELSLPQTALLAGLPNGPSLFDPYANEEAAKNRRDTVLMTMLDNEKITQQEYDEAVATPIDDGLVEPRNEDDNWKFYDNYLREVIAEVEEKTGVDVLKDGVDVYTNIDLTAQRRLYDIVNTEQYIQYPDGDMQVASTVIDTHTGKVVAQIGGRNIPEGTMLGENLAVNTKRDFGSTVKPIVDYAPAFEYLHYSTGKMIADEPYNYEGTNIPITNWDNSYMGRMTLRRALVLSRNVPAAKLFWEVGADQVAEFLEKMDIRYESIEQSNAISSNTSVQDGTTYGISSLKMAAAYAAFSNGGTYYEPQYVNKIVFQDGSEETQAFETNGSRAMEETTAYMVTDVLKDVISYGTGTNANIPGLYQAGKTGTSNYDDSERAQLGSVSSPSPDSNFVGYTPTYSMAVWTGYRDQKTPITSESSHIASEVYRTMMQFISASIPNEDWVMPDGLTRIGNELYLDGYVDPPTPPRSSSSTESSTTEETSTTESSTEESSSSSSSESETEEPSSSVEPPESSDEPSTPPSSSEEQPTESSESEDEGSSPPE